VAIYLSIASFFISAVALIIAGYIAYRNYLEKGRIDISLGETVDLVHPSSDQLERIHLNCSFANRGAKLGVVKKLVLLARSAPLDREIELLWNSFYNHNEKGEVVYEDHVHPVLVKGKESVFRRIEFSTGEPIQWKAGTHELELRGWRNEEDIESLPSLRVGFSVSLDEKTANNLTKETSTSRYLPITITY